MRQRIVYVISLTPHMRLFEWTGELLSKEKYELVFILMHSEETPFEISLRQSGFRVHRVHFRSKKDVPSAIWQIWQILMSERPAIVHTHFFEAGFAGMIAARLAGIKTRLHTRHDATIHHRYHPQAVKYDRLINILSTRIVAITENVRRILTEMEGVEGKKIEVIHHGFRFEEFEDVPSARIDAVRRRYQVPGGSTYVIGAISRFIEWKGVQYIIPAFQRLLSDSDSHLILANAKGPYSGELDGLLKAIPKDRYTLVPFEPDIPALYQLLDVFVHVPVDEYAEAFGLVYIEAMASRVPTVITLSGIARDFVRDREHALVVPYRDTDKVARAIAELRSNKVLAESLSLNAQRFVRENFRLEGMIRALEELYDERP